MQLLVVNKELNKELNNALDNDNKLLSNLNVQIIPQVVQYFKQTYASDKNDNGYYLLFAGTEMSGCIIDCFAEYEAFKHSDAKHKKYIYESNGDNLYFLIIWHSNDISKQYCIFNPDMLIENDVIQSKYDFGKILQNSQEIYKYYFKCCGNNPPPDCVNLSKNMQQYSAFNCMSLFDKYETDYNMNDDTDFCITHFRFISDNDAIDPNSIINIMSCVNTNEMHIVIK